MLVTTVTTGCAARTRSLAGGLMALLVLLGLTTSPVRASCGHYVVLGKEAAGRPVDSPAPQPPFPCSGPHCSREPASPLPTPAADRVAPVEQGLASLLLASPAEAGGTRVLL